jgi:hypothetical protein
MITPASIGSARFLYRTLTLSRWRGWYRASLDLALDRLDPSHAANWPAAMSGDPKANAVVLRIIDKRVALLGLDKLVDQPKKPRTLVIAGSHEEYVAGLQRAYAMALAED